MGNVCISKAEDNQYLIQISVFDDYERQVVRQQLTGGIVDTTLKLVQCGRIMSEVMMSSMSTKH